MPVYNCTAPACVYVTPDLEIAQATQHLLIHAQVAHPAQAPVGGGGGGGAAAAKPEKVRRPGIDKASTSEDWEYFLKRWANYKTATHLPARDVVVQLMECCADGLRRDLHRANSDLDTKPEADVIAAIKALAVRVENCMVSRVAFQQMHQDRDEGVRNYAARLRGQADVCKYTITTTCTCGVDVIGNYRNNMIKDTLIRGLEDQEIQQDVLGHENQDMSLEDTVKLIEAKESGKRSQASLHSDGAHAFSQYKKDKLKPVADKTKCGYCGSRGHGDGRDIETRKAKCKAYGQKCNKCGLRNHFETICKKTGESSVKPKDKGKGDKKDDSEDESSNLFDTLCVATGTITSGRNRGKKALVLDHHVFQECTGWLEKRSQSPPTLTVTAQARLSDYEHFGATLRDDVRPAVLSAVADTGCQSTLIGMKCVYKLGLKKSDLIPVTLKVKAINKEEVGLLGAVLLRFSGKNTRGKRFETAQICYVSGATDKLYLSREACVDLGLISAAFPQIGEAMKPPAVPEAFNDESEDTAAEITTDECNCPRRSMPPPTPDKLPFPATDDNRERLEKWLVEYYASSSFNTCTHQSLPLMEGPPLALHVDPSATPVAVHTPIPVPLHWQKEVKAGLDQDVRLGVLEPVPVGEQVTWCHRMVTCRKKSGKPRRTVDLQALNKHCTRETHHTQSPFHQATSVPAGTYKSVFDAWNGYHSVPIRVQDRHLTTFITPWGRYRYCTTPQGYIASGDGYSRRFDEIVSDFENKTKVIDDTCMWSYTLEESFYQACAWLDLCGRNGIVQNPEKFVFGAKTVTFAGFEITEDSVRPGDKFLRAIREFPTPTCITDIRAWYGLVNQVSYVDAVTDDMAPFREHLKPAIPFYWDSHLDMIFNDSKQAIIKKIENGVRIYDMNLKTCLSTDWSKTGVGFWLLQKHCSCDGDAPTCCTDGWRVTFAGSRFTHPAESRYAPVEGEALAVVHALENARHFVLGCEDLVVATDHQPLVKIFGDRKLEDIKNGRLLNLKEKTLPFRFKIIHVPGKRHLATDAISRRPSGAIIGEKLYLQDDNVEAAAVTTTDIRHHLLDKMCSWEPDISAAMEDEVSAAAASALGSLKSVTWDRVREATTSDNDMTDLVELIEDGFPRGRVDTPANLRGWHQFRDQLSTVDGVVTYNDRVVIPASLRDEVLKSIHSAHQGVTSMLSRVESSVFWPGITPAIVDMRARCDACNRMAPSQPHGPPIPAIEPVYPFQCVCSDFFHYKGHYYVVVVDRYSGWPIVQKAVGGAAGLIKCLRSTFVTFGIADELSSDGGPEFTALETRKFLTEWGVHHRLSSVALPHSNGRAEIGVKTVKRLIVDNTGADGDLDVDSFQKAMLIYRNTPDRDTKLSPAQVVFGRPIKDFIPVLPGKYKPHDTWRENRRNREEALRCRHAQTIERLAEHTVRIKPLKVGDHVRIQNQTGTQPRKWDRTGLVIEVRQFDQYVVRVDGSGRVTLRNRKFLRLYTPYVAPAAPRQPDASGQPLNMGRSTAAQQSPPTTGPSSTSAVRSPMTGPSSTPAVRSPPTGTRGPTPVPQTPAHSPPGLRGRSTTSTPAATPASPALRGRRLSYDAVHLPVIEPVAVPQEQAEHDPQEPEEPEEQVQAAVPDPVPDRVPVRRSGRATRQPERLADYYLGE